MQAIWLLVVAFGNLIDIIVVQAESGSSGGGLSQVSSDILLKQGDVIIYF